jgi:hypothetical protein
MGNPNFIERNGLQNYAAPFYNVESSALKWLVQKGRVKKSYTEAINVLFHFGFVLSLSRWPDIQL